MVKSNQLVATNCSCEKAMAQIEFQNLTKNWV